MRNPVIFIALMLLPSVAVSATYTFEGEAFTIPSSGPADPSFIYVEGVEGVVIDVSFHVKGFSHYYGNETMVALSNPDGWATLIWDTPPCVFNNADITISDAATDDIGQTCSASSTLYGGTFTAGYGSSTREFTIPIAPIRPLFPKMSDLFLENPNGRWILWSEDFVGGDGGTSESWQLVIETQDM